MTELVKAIDVCYVYASSRYTGICLMNGHNTEIWEGDITTMEIRVLLSHLVFRAQKRILEKKQDSLCVV